MTFANRWVGIRIVQHDNDARLGCGGAEDETQIGGGMPEREVDSFNRPASVTPLAVAGKPRLA